MDLDLTGRRALVTGGSRGIGKAVARALAEEGAHVAIAARDLTTLSATASELADMTGGRVVPVRMDTGDTASVAAAIDEVIDLLGGLDILVNNAAVPAGQATPPRLADLSDDVFWDDVNVKVLGYLRCARAAEPHLRANGWGRIVNISGLAARTTGSTVSSMRNVAVAALTKNLADEFAGSGVNVTCVHPGLTRTERTPGVVAARAAAAEVDEVEAERRMAASSAIGRLVDAEEVAWLVAFLASPRSVAVNGDAIACGGGQVGSIHY